MQLIVIGTKLNKKDFVKTTRLWLDMAVDSINYEDKLYLMDAIIKLAEDNMEHMTPKYRRSIQDKTISLISASVMNDTDYPELCRKIYNKHRHFIFDGYINRYGRTIHKPKRYQ